MAIQKTEAIVLKTQPLRSSSLIVTFFTRDFGKVRGVAKGVRQEREMRGALYELFTHLEIVFYEKTRSDLHLVSEGFILESFEGLRSRLDSICYASYFAELVDQLSEVHDPHPKIFDLLRFVFRYLPSIPGPRLARLFEIQLLNEIGWLPHLDRCLICQKDTLEKGFFSARQGSLLCPSCAGQFPDAKPLGRQPLSVMRYYIRHQPEESIRLAMSRETERELESLMSRFLEDRFSNPLKSKRFLEEISPVLRLS